MQFKLLPILPWTPTAAFSGTSEYTIDPYNGLIRRHVDTWDSIENSHHVSVEGLRYALVSFAQVRELRSQGWCMLRSLRTHSNTSHLGVVSVKSTAFRLR